MPEKVALVTGGLRGLGRPMRRVLILGPVAVLGIWWATFAFSDAPAPPAELLRYILQPAHQEAVANVMRAQVAVIPNCRPVKVTGHFRSLLKPVTWRDNGSPATGQWTENVHIEGCSGSGIFTLMTTVDDAGKIQVVSLLPGTTIADALLQRDTVITAVAGALFYMHGVGVKDCQQVRVIDTAFIAFEGPPPADVRPGSQARPWREDWTVIACNTSVVVPLHFQPEKKGTWAKTNNGEARAK